MNPIEVPCDNCHAPKGDPCTYPTERGRVAVTWFHAVRTDLAAGWR